MESLENIVADMAGNADNSDNADKNTSSIP